MSVPSSPVITVPEILIIGGTGHVGLQTVIALARDKSSRRYSVKAGCRNVEKGRKMLDAFGVGTVYMDLGKPETIDVALAGITKVFFISAYNAYTTEHASSLIEACTRSEKLEHLVILSVAQCEKQTSAHQIHYKEIEEMLEKSTLKWTRLRSACFMENFVSMENSVRDSKIILPIEDARFSPVSVSDVGEAAANILLGSPEKHAFKTYTLTGPQLLTGQEISEVFEKVFGKKFEFVSPNREEARNAYLANGMEKHYVELLLEIMESIARKEHDLLTQDAELLLGRPPLNLEQVVIVHKNHFISLRPTMEMSSVPLK